MNVTLLEGLAALAALSPAIGLSRVLAQPGARRRLQVFAPFAYKAVLGLLVYVGVILALAARAPKLLLPAGGAALAALLVERWQARNDYGEASALPPGSLSFFKLGPWSDQEFFRKEIERHGPVFKVRIAPRPTICVYGLERAQRLHEAHGHQLGTGMQPPFERWIPGGFLRSLQDGTRGRYIPLFARAFSRELIYENRDRIGAQIAAGLGEVTEGDSLLKSHDVVEILFPIFSGLCLGAWDPPEVKELRKDFAKIDLRYGLSRSPWTERAAVRKLEAGLFSKLESLDAIDDSGFQSALTNLIQEDPAATQGQVVIRNLIFLTMTSWHDVSGLSVWLLKLLSDYPSVVEEIRAELDGDSPGRPPLTLLAVREALRLQQSEFVSRTVLDEFEFERFRFPKGWRLRILEHENHRDPALFDRPNEFWPQRFRESPPPASSYAPFGVAGIRCLGVQLTLAVGESLARELCGHYEWTVVADGPPEFGGLHWRPNSRFAVALEARAAAHRKNSAAG